MVIHAKSSGPVIWSHYLMYLIKKVTTPTFALLPAFPSARYAQNSFDKHGVLFKGHCSELSLNDLRTSAYNAGDSKLL